MGRPKLAPAAKRIRIDVTLAPATVAALDALVACGRAPTRSAAIETAVQSYYVNPRRRAATKEATK